MHLSTGCCIVDEVLEHSYWGANVVALEVSLALTCVDFGVVDFGIVDEVLEHSYWGANVVALEASLALTSEAGLSRAVFASQASPSH